MANEIICQPVVNYQYVLKFQLLDMPALDNYLEIYRILYISIYIYIFMYIKPIPPQHGQSLGPIFDGVNLAQNSKDDEKGEALEAACHLMSDLAELLEGVYQGPHLDGI